MLNIEEVTISAKYLDYTDVFSLNSVIVLFKHIDINDHLINLIDDKQQFYSPIYSLEPIKLKTLKTYIKISLANSFIRPSKLSAGALILFIIKKNDSVLTSKI